MLLAAALVAHFIGWAQTSPWLQIGGGIGMVLVVVGVLLTELGVTIDKATARRRALNGRCLKCNYNRAGLAVEAVCPECGSPAA